MWAGSRLGTGKAWNRRFAAPLAKQTLWAQSAGIMNSPWDQRYLAPEYVCGTAPNAFAEAMAGHIPEGPVLCLAAGEGRNAVHLAGSAIP